MDEPMEPAPSVAAWPGVELGGRLSGGARNPVYRAGRGNEDLVVRISGRTASSLDWELDLLELLGSHGIVVPQALQTGDGRRHDDGVLVQRFIPGAAPSHARDWGRVVCVLKDVHELTRGWPQRPGFASARQLMTSETGGDVDLAAMPAAAAEAVRASWMPMLGAPECVVHGDLGAGNVLVTQDPDVPVALIDWDEARVDVPAFDFAHVPHGIEVPLAGSREDLVTAGVGWEAATCWVAEPEYAARRLAVLRAKVG